ncbi:MAG TPA: hypothetical protein VFF76_07845 [Holophagaceae bacterium]|jgi:hypothetical protein|nr:hypothetical protein [Holophagaceae bacterium]
MRTFLLTALSLPLIAQAPELRTTAADRTGLSITIYQNDLAAVRDTRRVSLPAGVTRLAFADLAASIRSKSAYLLNTGPRVKVLERNFEFNLLSPESLEKASLDLPLALRDTKTGKLQWGSQVSFPYPNGIWNLRARPLDRMLRKPNAWLLPPTSDLLVRMSDGFEATSGQPPIYQSLPLDLRSSPTLLQTIETATAGPQSLNLLYTTQGLSWHADYIATLSTDAKHLDLDVFATVNNNSGIDYPDAAFQLVAGEPNKVYDPDPSDKMPTLDMTATTVEVVGSATVIGPPVFKEERISEYPLFTLDRPTTLKNGQTKQLALFHTADVPMKVQALVWSEDLIERNEDAYLHTLSQWLDNKFDEPPHGRVAVNLPLRPAEVDLQGLVKNTKSNHLGKALPSGELDIRYRSPEGALLVFGRPLMGGTPAGEDLTIQLPPGKGLSSTRKIASLRVATRQGMIALDLEVIVTLSNASNQALQAIIREPIFANWKLLSSNFPGHRSGENAYDFNFVSKPHSTTALRYRVRTSYQ